MDEEVDLLHIKIREIKEDYAEKEGQMKVLTMTLASNEKQRVHLANEVRRLNNKRKSSGFLFPEIFITFQIGKCDELLSQYKANNEKLQQQYRDANCALIQSDQQVCSFSCASFS